MKTLSIKHNAGFFSCATIRLIGIMKYFNKHKKLPDIVDSSKQFAFYKENLDDDIVPRFYEESADDMIHRGEISLTLEAGEVSFSDYSKFNFIDTVPFVNKYFAPSKEVRCIVSDYERNYNIDYDNTCAVFYRGNDKQRECEVTPYEDFIEAAHKVLEGNPNIKFLVQPDETEFLQAFTAAFPDRCFHFAETPHMRKKNSAIFYELPPNKKTEHGCYFLGAVIVMSKCKHLITHSGNGGMWCVLYRGNAVGVKQFFNKHIY